MVSTSSSSPALKQDDNLFRLAPDDFNQAAAITAMLRSYGDGIDAVVIIQRTDEWGNGLTEAFIQAYQEAGGDIVSQIPYDPWSIAPDDPDYGDILQAAEDAAIEDLLEYGARRVGVLLFSFGESVPMIIEAAGYPTIYDLPWFGGDGTALNLAHVTDAPSESCHVTLMSTLSAPTGSPKYIEMAERYETLDIGPLNFYTACHADAAWIIVQSVLETHSPRQLKKVDTQAIVDIFPHVSDRHFGYIGWCRLDEFGDRQVVSYDIWGYGVDHNGVVDMIRYGSYGLSGEVTWDTEFYPPAPCP